MWEIEEDRLYSLYIPKLWKAVQYSNCNKDLFAETKPVCQSL